MRLPNGSKCRSIAVGGEWLAVLLVLLAITNTAESHGKLRIQFLRYSSGGLNAFGAACDAGYDGRCDPQFQVTVKKEMKEGENVFIYQQIGHYTNRNSIQFLSTFGERPNPLVIDLNYVDNQGHVWFEILVTDIGSDNSHKLMSMFTSLLHTSDTEIRNLELKSRGNDSLTVRYWYSCSADYYGSLCNEHCNEKSERIWCGSNGGKICRFGWVDVSTGCKKPHPCRTCVCRNGGICEPDGTEGYKCHCLAGYSGDNCYDCHLEAGQCGKGSPNASSCDPMAPREIHTGFSTKVLVGAMGGAAGVAMIVMIVIFACFKRK